MEDSFVLENMSTLCRLCLGRAAVMTNIHDHEDLAGKIAEFAELQIDPEDGLPDQICYKCLFKVEKCSKFRQQCTQTDSRLRQLTGHYTNEGSNSEENYEQGETKYKGDYVVEDSVVMVVDPNLDCDSSDGEMQPTERAETDVQDQQNSHELEDDDIGRAAESFFKNVFMCKHCDRAFITYQECRQHELHDHDPNTPYPCTECPLVFQHRPLFIQHAKIAHGNDKPYCCTQCEKTFSRRSDLRKHSIVHTGIRPYQCQYCMKSFSRNTNLSKHLRIHAGQKPHVCPHCPRSFVARDDLDRHVLVHAGLKPFSCRQCPLTFGRKDKLMKHEMKHGIVPSIKMEESDDETITDDGMVISLNPYNNTNVRPYTATQNDSDGFNLPSVPDHITGESSFDQLSAQILTASQMKPQVPQTSPPKPKLISIKNKPKNIKCHQCPKRFATLDAYKSHMAGHMGLRVGPNTYQCKVCFKKFCQKEDLVRHSLLHDEMKPFACTQCDKSFSRRDKLRKHERSHDTTVSNMPCIECGATFELKADLVAHIKSHFADNSDATDKYNDDDDIKKEQGSSNTDDNAYDLET